MSLFHCLAVAISSLMGLCGKKCGFWRWKVVSRRYRWYIVYGKWLWEMRWTIRLDFSFWILLVLLWGSLSLSLSIKKWWLSFWLDYSTSCPRDTPKPYRPIVWWIEPWTFRFMSRPKPSSTCSKYNQGGHLVQTEKKRKEKKKRMFFMMMWIGLSNNQTIEIELFGTLEVEENSQFASNMNFLDRKSVV